MDGFGFYDGALELRQEGGGPPVLAGVFPYNSLAVVSNVGRVRKETFRPGSFTYSLRRAADSADNFAIDLLSGHSFDRPLASTRTGALVFDDGPDSLRFRATLPEPADAPSWVRDTILAVRAGLARGVSPGFRLAPRAINPNAETLEDELGNPGVQVRVLNDVILPELSIVTRAAYPETDVEARADEAGARRAVDRSERARRWL